VYGSGKFIIFKSLVDRHTWISKDTVQSLHDFSTKRGEIKGNWVKLQYPLQFISILRAMDFFFLYSLSDSYSEWFICLSIRICFLVLNYVFLCVQVCDFGRCGN